MFKVMIVDDMDIVRREIRRLKIWGEEAGFILAEEAKNGQEALAKLAQAPADIVITDIKMPKVDGLELLKKITEKNLCPCVVLLSDYSEFSYARQGIILGAFDYMTKPVNEEEFSKILKRAGAFLQDIRREKERIKMLEERLDEKIGAFYPAAEVRHIAELVEAGEARVLERVSRTVDTIGASLDFDLIKVERILKNVQQEVMEILFDNNKWLERFISPEELEDTDFLQGSDFNAMKKIFAGKIESLRSLINRLRCGRRGDELVDRVSGFVLEHTDGEVSLKTAADALFMNKTYLSEAFKQKTGTSFTEYLTSVKMERPKKLLSDSRIKAYEAAQILGFKDIEYFSRLFKKHTGMTPTEFRLNHTIKD